MNCRTLPDLAANRKIRIDGHKPDVPSGRTSARTIGLCAILNRQNMAEQKSILQDYDRYISGLFAPEDDALKFARAEMRRENMPEIKRFRQRG